MEKYELEIIDKTNAIWRSAIEAADTFVSKTELNSLNECNVESVAENCKSTFGIDLFKISKLTYNPDEGIIDKLVNVYSAMHCIGSSVFIIVVGDKTGFTNFFLGAKSRGKSDMSAELLRSSFMGNFPGIEIVPCDSGEKNMVLDDCLPLNYSRKSIASLSVSADLRKNKTEENIKYIQGIEKFIDSMKGQSYCAVILSEPLSKEDCVEKRIGLESIVTELSKYSKVSVGYNEGTSIGVSESLSKGVTTNISKSISHSISKSTSVSIGKNIGRSSGRNSMGFFGITHNSGYNYGKNKTKTKGDSISDSASETNSEGESESETKGSSQTNTEGTTLTLNVENKTICNVISKIEYELKKLDNSDSFGLWDTAAYIIADNDITSIIGASCLRSLVIGDDSGKSESHINCWKNSSDYYNKKGVREIFEFLHYGMHPVFSKNLALNSFQSQTIKCDYTFTPAVSISGNALPYIMGLPMKSVSGVTVVESAEFGRNIVTDNKGTKGNRKIRLGEVVYMGHKDGTIVELLANSLSAHTFVCGAPGSGKSNTIYKLLYGLSNLSAKPERDENYGNVNFLVIEPAKGEYKYEFGRMPNINIFTAQSNLCRLLRINPFEFPYENMGVMEHIDRLKDIISACWSLTAAMPAILSDSLETAYRKKGWDLKNSVYVFPGQVKFPSFKDVLDVLPIIIKNSSYSAEAKGDYTGALVTRVSSMVKGMVGNIFTDTGTVRDEVLFGENTIVDLSAIGSTESRALIMGILILKLTNYRKSTATQANYPLRHVTVLEEAHNILPNCSTSQSEDSSNVLGKSVESISNAISEMRTYGEGFIIVDQSPSAVAKVAVSNTSTKIVLRLPEEDDIKAVGTSMSLTEGQMEQIPMLPSGYSILRQGNWLTAVQALVDKAPSVYSTKKLDSYDYDTLKQFRAELIKKCLQVNYRNGKRDKFVSADRDLIIKYIDKQYDIAEHHKDYVSSRWNEYCSFDRIKRQNQISVFIMDVVSFYDGLEICKPEINSIPKDINDPGDEFLDSLKKWVDLIEVVLDSYVTCTDDEKSDIVYYIFRYCNEKITREDYKVCALTMLSMFYATNGGA